MPLALAYLLGSIGFGVIVPRLRGIDIYRVGSGNPGVSNVYRSLGKGPAALVLVGDAGKGAAAAAIGALWAGAATSTATGETLSVACAFFAVAGHILPIWHRFRGGRGVATALGGLLYLAWLPGLVLALGWLAVTLFFKVASIASLAAMALYLPALALGGARGWSLAWGAGIVVLVVVRHLPNIRRLFAGSERKVVEA